MIPKIIISSAPHDDADFSKFAAVINVSDSACTTFSANVPSFWFPIHETGKWGYGPFYGAAKVIDKYGGDKPILIHCHGGVNRSPSITYAVLKSNGVSEEHFDILFPIYGDSGMKCIFERNLKKNCVPFDVIAMLTARLQNPDYSIMGLLGAIKSPNLFHSTFKKSD